MDVRDLDQNSATVTLTHEELAIVGTALNEVCNGIELFEFETRMGASRDRVAEVLSQFRGVLDKLTSRRP